MQAYMRSQMPFLGVQKPARVRALRPLFAAHPFIDRDAYESTVLTLWREATYREERYAALALTETAPARRWQDPAALPLYDELVVTGAWWDLVDEVASRRIGPILREFPAEVVPVMQRWAFDADMWRRRTAIICQIGSRETTDLDLLSVAIEANASDRDFFIRKAIGWALREHTKIDPSWVRSFVAAHDNLSSLSRREAVRNLPSNSSRTSSRP